MIGPFHLSILFFFVFFLKFFFITLCFFGSVRQTKLAVRQLLSAHKYRLSYRIDGVAARRIGRRTRNQVVAG